MTDKFWCMVNKKDYLEISYTPSSNKVHLITEVDDDEEKVVVLNKSQTELLIYRLQGILKEMEG